MSTSFKCKECGSGGLAFSRYAKCLIPVVITNDGQLEFLEAVVNSDDYIDDEDYFCCFECGSRVGDHTDHLQTEQELLDYLSGEVGDKTKCKKFREE